MLQCAQNARFAAAIPSETPACFPLITNAPSCPWPARLVLDSSPYLSRQLIIFSFKPAASKFENVKNSHALPSYNNISGPVKFVLIFHVLSLIGWSTESLTFFDLLHDMLKTHLPNTQGFLMRLAFALDIFHTLFCHVYLFH